MPVGIDLYIALAAAWTLGATVVFPEPAMGLRGFRHAVKTTQPRAFFGSGPYRWLGLILPQLWRCKTLAPKAFDTGAHTPVPLTDDDPALISFTSGSTGAPKAILRDHGFLMAQKAAVDPLLTTDKDDVDLVAFPVFVLLNLAAGRTSVLPSWRAGQQDDVTGDALAHWIDANKATRLLLPPALCETLSQCDLPDSVHTIFTGGGPVFPGLVERLKSNQPRLRVVSVYGSTEAEPIAELDWADLSRADHDTMATGGGLLAGKPVPDIRIRIVDEEIQIAGPHVNDGYLSPADDRSTKLREGDTIWHRTGDAGWLDDEGRLWLLGRLSAVATKNGHRIHPFPVEVAAQSWPGVTRAALWSGDDRLVLVIEGVGVDETDCARKAAALGLDDVRVVREIPLDRRHRSKIDYPALNAMMRRG